jgi:hypothetical protein
MLSKVWQPSYQKTNADFYRGFVLFNYLIGHDILVTNIKLLNSCSFFSYQ